MTPHVELEDSRPEGLVPPSGLDEETLAGAPPRSVEHTAPGPVRLVWRVALIAGCALVAIAGAELVLASGVLGAQPLTTLWGLLALGLLGVAGAGMIAGALRAFLGPG